MSVLDLPVSNGKELVSELGKNAIFTPADVSCLDTAFWTHSWFRLPTMSRF